VSVRPRLWQTTLARLFWARCGLSKVAAGAPLAADAADSMTTS